MDGNEKQPGYKVQIVEGCAIVWGEIPVSEIPKIASHLPGGGNVETSRVLAEKIGANMVFGSAEHLTKLAGTQHLPASIELMRQQVQRLPETVSKWLRKGDRCEAADAMCKAMFGVPVNAGIHHPTTPLDFRRCLAFIDATGTWDTFDKVAKLSPAWDALIEEWLQIHALYVCESRDSVAIETQKLLDEILESVNQRGTP